MIKFPYGMSDFRQIIAEGYYYRDRGVDAAKLVYQYTLPPVIRALEEGKAQVTDYEQRLGRKYKDLRLKKFLVVSLGFEWICFVNTDDLNRG